MAIKLHQIQSLLNRYHIDGWLLYDFRRSNVLALRLLSIPDDELLTRRFFYWIPATGLPVKIISSVENPLTHLPGSEAIFHSWQELMSILKTVLKGQKKVAMEYAPMGTTPEVSRVDGGTIDMVKSFGVEVVSSGDLLQELMCVWDEEKWKSHQVAAKVLEDVASDTWGWLGGEISQERSPTEYDVSQRMLKEIQRRGCTTDHPPICAVNAHSSNPHYMPKKEGSSKIKKGDWILIDLWCKENKPGSVYADITRVGVASDEPSEKQQKIFLIVQQAQQAAFDFVEKKYQENKPIFGHEVDRLCRTVIEEAGYGDYFLHRTGHNIDTTDHGPGAHLDDLETHEIRRLLPGTCFSIEPGIYLPKEFGVRLEYDVYLTPEGKAVISGGIQDSIEKIVN